MSRAAQEHLRRLAAGIVSIAAISSAGLPHLHASPAAAAVARAATVTIKNPPRAICLGQTYTLQAEGLPAGGTYSWTVKRGADQVDPDSGTGASFAITGTLKSPRVDDVQIEVEYVKGADKVKAMTELTVVQVKLESVTFGGAGNHVVSQDAGGPDYATTHWLDAKLDGNATDPAGDRRFPLLYERSSNATGTRVTVTRVVAKVEPADFKRAVVPVRGVGPDGDDFSGSGALDKGTLTVSAAMTADDKLPATIRFYDPYAVQWELALTDNDWCKFGNSDNRLYVALAPPANKPVYETVVHLACRSAAGTSTNQKAVDAMWAELADRKVERKPIDGFNRKDGVRMGYWRPVGKNRQTLAQMLADGVGEGSCHSWAQLLKEMAEVHGIQGGQNRLYELRVDPDPKKGHGADGFLVQKWAFTHEFVHTGAMNGLNDSDKKGDDRDFVKKGDGYPFTVCIKPGVDGKLETRPQDDDEIFGAEIHTGPDGVCDTKAAKSDVQFMPFGEGKRSMPCILGGKNDQIDSTVNNDDRKVATAKGKQPFPFVVGLSAINLPGIAGQDNPEPPGSFGNHFIVKLLGKFYDPSYGGNPYDTEDAHENAAISGLLKGVLARRADGSVSELTYIPR